jgi:heat shock protein HtpX
MARTRYATDRGLIARMGATMFLLGLVFVAFIAALVYLLGAFSNISSAGIVFIAALFGIGTAFVSYSGPTRSPCARPAPVKSARSRPRNCTG